MQKMDRHAMPTVPALVLCSLIIGFLVSPVVSDGGCAAVERFDEALDNTVPPATLIQEYVDIDSASDCFMRCCSLEQDGCNTASFMAYGDRNVCVVARCIPYDSCIWIPFPDAVSAVIERQANDPSSVKNTTDSDTSSREGGTDSSGSDDATVHTTTAANIQGDSDLLMQKTDSNPSEEHTNDEDLRSNESDEEAGYFDDATGYDSDYETGSDADGRAKTPEVKSHEKPHRSAWHEVFNKPLVSIVSGIVVIFFLAVVVFLVRYLVGMHERAVYKPLIDRFMTVSYSD